MKSFSAVAVAALLLLGAPAAFAMAAPAAASVDDFLDSIGVDQHVDQGYEPGSYVEPLRYTGIREVREGPRHVAGNIMIHEKTGVRFALNGGGDLAALLSSGRALAKAGALLALEGPNEPNNFPIVFNAQRGGGPGRSWFAVADFQRSLYAGAKSDPLLRRIPIFDPSETGAETDDVGLQFLTIPAGRGMSLAAGTRFADFANVHNYVIGNGRRYTDNQAWNAADPTLDGRWDGLYGNYGITWFRHYRGYTRNQLATLPRVTTETGWDSVSDPGGERVQATILVNTCLAQFSRGWSYTFIYEMRDGEGGSGHQGLYDGARPKLSAVYIHNLTTILAEEPGQPGRSAPQRLAYEVAQPPDTVHQILLRKSSGAFDLILWDERVQGHDQVTVLFRKAVRSLKIYDVAAGTVPVRTQASATMVHLDLSDHAVILEVAAR